MSSMSKATKAVLTGVGGALAVSAFHAVVSARTPLTMTGTLCQVSRSQGHAAMSTFKADTAFKLRPPRSPRPFSVIGTGSVSDIAKCKSVLNGNKTKFLIVEQFVVRYS